MRLGYWNVSNNKFPSFSVFLETHWCNEREDFGLLVYLLKKEALRVIDVSKWLQRSPSQAMPQNCHIFVSGSYCRSANQVNWQCTGTHTASPISSPVLEVFAKFWKHFVMNVHVVCCRKRKGKSEGSCWGYSLKPQKIFNILLNK